ncbi:MAG: hydratase [Ruminococcaceae bacterium]|nr:hydratase [Oscillospiraceae bacterium]
MISLSKSGVYLKDGSLLSLRDASALGLDAPGEAKKKTMAYSILKAHNTSDTMNSLKIKFDAMASHDITYVGIIQTARASGLEKFPLPYVLTNCHNSLCAVGGTINEDDHLFGLSAAKKYGGEFVPAHQAVIHQYMRERYAGCGKMILASDSHTRYGALGSISIGEGGPELARQLLSKTYNIAYPEVVCVYLEGAPRPGVGPQDIALAIIGAVFNNGHVKNKIMEFVGPGIANLSMDFRNGIDVMTTETSCLSSIWETDKTVCEFLTAHGRGDEYKPLHPENGAYYDCAVCVDLSKVEPMIALPFHPSNAFKISELKANLPELLAKVDRDAKEMLGIDDKSVSLLNKIKNGELYVEQGFVGGCSGGLFQNIHRVRDILKGNTTGDGAFWLSVYPASSPMSMELMRDGTLADLTAAGVSIRSCFCGPCFGAGDVPANGALSIRHATRNFPNREGSKPGDGQISYVALMDARSIAATALNGGKLTSAFELENIPEDPKDEKYTYDATPYKSRIYYGVGNPQPEAELKFGPNIADWPEMIGMTDNLLISVASAIYDPVTTTDELIPSGETSSYRSNPIKLASFALSRKDPEYVGRTKVVYAAELARREGKKDALDVFSVDGIDMSKTSVGTCVFALKPGDGSAREQAASCQRVLGGVANIASEYATKRYRSNVVNWGMLPFILDDAESFGIEANDLIYIEGIRDVLLGDDEEVKATLIKGGDKKEITLRLPALTREERDIILAGCLINFYSK